MGGCGGARAGGSGRAQFMIVCRRLVCRRVRTSRARSSMVVSGAEAEPGEGPPVLEVAEAVLDWARAADRAW